MTEQLIRVNHLEIVHKGCFNDGYPTYVVIDGKMFPDYNPPRYDKTITLIAEALELLKIVVEFRDGGVETYSPLQFDLTMGDIRILLHPDRCPCKIFVGTHEPRVRSLVVRFASGEAVWVNLKLLPIPDPNPDYLVGTEISNSHGR